MRRIIVHGFTSLKHPLYQIWFQMKRRCLNTNSADYKDYGARGITVCERWLTFKNFAEDMYPKPFPEASLERKNNNKGYCPDNCMWATPSEQAHNRRVRRTSRVQSLGIVLLPNGTYYLRFCDKGVNYTLGTFAALNEAEDYRSKFLELYKRQDPAAFDMISTKTKPRVKRTSVTGISGICPNRKGFVVYKKINGKMKTLGRAKTIEEGKIILDKFNGVS